MTQQRVQGVYTADTRKLLDDAFNAAGEQYGFDPAWLVALAIAESDLREHMVGDPHVAGGSNGLFQIAAEYHPSMPRANAIVAEVAIIYAAPLFKQFLNRTQNPLAAMRLWNKPRDGVVTAAVEANYRRGLAEAERYRVREASMMEVVDGVAVVDWSNDQAKLPRDQFGKASYGKYFPRRALADITYAAIHHADAVSGIQAISRYHQEKDWGGGSRAPHIAYWAAIPDDPMGFLQDRGIIAPGARSVFVICNEITEAGWATTSGNPYAAAIVLCSDLDVKEPSESQLLALQVGLVRVLPRALGGRFIARNRVFGHGECGGIYGGGPGWGNATACPGAKFIDDVRAYRAGRDFASLTTQPVPTVPTDPDPIDGLMDGYSVGLGFEEYLRAHPEFGRPRMDNKGLPDGSGTFIWTKPTPQHPKGAMLVWRQWTNSVAPVVWD